MLIFHTIMLSTHTLIINNELTVTDEGVIIFEKICSLKNSIQLKLAFICWQTGHHIWNRKNFRNKNKHGLTSWGKLKNLPRPLFVKPICWPNICDEYKKSNYSLLDLAWFKKIALVQNAFNYPLMKINLGIANKCFLTSVGTNYSADFDITFSFWTYELEKIRYPHALVLITMRRSFLSLFYPFSLL